MNGYKSFCGYTVPFGTFLGDEWKDVKARIESQYATVRVLDSHVKDDNGNMQTFLFVVAESSVLDDVGHKEFGNHMSETLEKELKEFRLSESIFTPGKIHYGVNMV